MTLVLHAPNVHDGGGARLLTALIQTELRGVQRHVFVDQRYLLPALIAENTAIYRVAGSLQGRVWAEWRLRAFAKAHDVVVCLGNLPPAFRLRAKTVLFLQNRHLVEALPIGFPLKMRLRIAAERIWLRRKLNNVDGIVVQTPTMQRLVRSALGVAANIMPFTKDLVVRRESREPARDLSFDFLYVSSGEPHKNHLALIEAWRLLAQENIRPHLGVTLSDDRDRSLCLAISEACGAYGLNITNTGVTSLDRMHELYSAAKAFIFPSLGESLGLPLLEAAAAGLPIIAPEADYVRDVVDPAQTFDPTSPISIARAIKRHLCLPESRTLSSSPEQFMMAIMSGDFSSKTGV